MSPGANISLARYSSRNRAVSSDLIISGWVACSTLIRMLNSARKSSGRSGPCGLIAFVGALRQVIREILRHLVSFVLRDPVLAYEPGEKSAVDAAASVMPRREREEQQRIVFSAHRALQV